MSADSQMQPVQQSPGRYKDDGRSLTTVWMHPRPPSYSPVSQDRPTHPIVHRTEEDELVP